MRGAVGFRQIPQSNIFATGQPTQDAISTILESVRERCPEVTAIMWICLREEPLVMINGAYHDQEPQTLSDEQALLTVCVVTVQP